MPGYNQTQRAPAQRKAADGGLADHRTAAPVGAPAADALTASLNQSPQVQSLLQTRQAIDEGPRVQSQLMLQRVLNRREAGPASEASQVLQQEQGRVKPTLQAKGVAINHGAVVQRQKGLAVNTPVKIYPKGFSLEGTINEVRGDHYLVTVTGGAIKMYPEGVVEALDKKSDLKDPIDVKSAVPASQGATYRGKTPINNVTLEVAVTNNGSGQILIVDQTKNKKWTKSLTGHINYELDAAAKTLALMDFSATPTELGLGTLLLVELAMFAKEKAIALIVVPAPAATAMRAYEVFGGMPWNPKKQERDAKDYQQDFATVPADPTVPAPHKSFVHQEAQEHASEKATRETFFDPPSVDAKEVKAKKDKVYKEAYEAHVGKHTGQQDYARAARLKALSGHLTYNSDALLQRTLAMFARKWTKLG